AGRKTAGKDLAGFDVVPTVPVVVGEDSADGLEACAAPLRHHAALYVGGMGSREQNFYNRLAVSMGYDDAAARVQDLYLARQHRDAAEAVPFEFIDRTSLIGPPERIRDRLHAYAEAGVTTLSVASYAGSLDERVAALRTLSEALDASGLGE
ncbi:MAG: LLM class flavin-dependent oxidoreductase, partial [Actinomycetes bacterium]